LGKAIGNLIEVKETIYFLSGNVNNYPDLKELIYEFEMKILVEIKKKSSLQTISRKS